MLRNTFCHVSALGEKLEAKMWDAGITSWNKLDLLQELGLSKNKITKICDEICQSEEQLSANNLRYFADKLKSNQHWRLFPEYLDRIAYIDIETTGLDKYSSHITTVALYDGKQVKHYIYGQNLTDFVNDFNQYDMVVTFNGKCFDLPYLENHFNCDFNHVHLDLRYILKTLGFQGGLKKIEKVLNIDRGDLDGVDGYLAVLLWYEYVNYNNQAALDTLLAYNIEDTINLEKLMVLAYNMKTKDLMENLVEPIAIESDVQSPFTPDHNIINKFRTY